MHVVATAGHVDHGKSTLVRALTGLEPDRWAEERRRGMTIDLGFVWTDLPSGRTVAVVDVPGHERFVPTMLAGLGPVPAVLLVVAADGGWMPQSQEHLDAIDALGVRHGLLAVTRTDLADPAPATAAALDRIVGTSLGTVEAVAVSGATGRGLDDLRAALDRLVAHLPEPDHDAPVRLWVDRCFPIRGAGTVVTGTLGVGRLAVGDDLELARDGRRVAIRGLQTLSRPEREVTGTARVAVNLRGVGHEELGRGDALLTPGRFRATDVVDARVDVRAGRSEEGRLPSRLVLHVGAAAVPVRVRPLAPDTARLQLAHPLPLVVGDRVLLRDPGRHRIVAGATLLDVAPPPLRRRGAAAARADVLAGLDGRPDEASELRRRGLVRAADLRRLGVTVTAEPVAGEWLADPQAWAELRDRLPTTVEAWRTAHPLDAGPPLEAVRQQLGLPDLALASALVAPPLEVRDGRVVRAGSTAALPEPVERAVAAVAADLARAPFAAPDAGRLAELGLGPRELAAAARAGRLLRVADGVVLRPDALDRAVERLGSVPAPFALSEARQALGTSRRVAVPLLELLDRRGRTVRLPDDRRRLAGPGDR